MWRTRALLALGTTTRLRIAHADAAQADRALGAAAAAILAVDASMSLFRPTSEVARLNRAGRLMSPSAGLLAVLREAQRVSARSDGAFDVTVQPLWLAHDLAHQAGRLASTAELTAARSRIGWQGLLVADDHITLARPGMAITLNGIAQGYATDAALAALRAHGVSDALVDAGEFAACGYNEQGRAWTLGIEDPHDEARLVTALHLDGRALATSADHRSSFTPDHRHHHIIDPATGRSPPALSSVSVLAPSAMRADALTKVMFMAGPARIAGLARQWGVDVLWVDKQGRWSATAGLHASLS
ncbi:MAG: FAD:protein FMN transferase [Burkholderiales bacterium]|nr:FAD:protein FMN transferase [Burkholderiales bacterium]